MRFKVDENLPDEVCNLLNGAGYDAISVGQQGVAGLHGPPARALLHFADAPRLAPLCHQGRE
jgi:hypothetical protein